MSIWRTWIAKVSAIQLWVARVSAIRFWVARVSAIRFEFKFAKILAIQIGPIIFFWLAIYDELELPKFRQFRFELPKFKQFDFELPKFQQFEPMLSCQSFGNSILNCRSFSNSILNCQSFSNSNLNCQSFGNSMSYIEEQATEFRILVSDNWQQLPNQATPMLQFSCSSQINLENVFLNYFKQNYTF